MKGLENAKVEKDFLKKVIAHIEYNKTIIEYHDKFSSEMPKHYGLAFNKNTLDNITDRITDCNKVWELDKYEQAKVKDFKKTNLCRNKFCANCKKVKQSARMARYIPVLEQYQDRLYHLTLTLPNCKSVELPYTVRKMATCFKRVIRYLTGDAKIKGLDFSSFGYEGAVRSLEVTFHGDSYHPHYHVGLVLDPSVLTKKRYKNKYSYNYKSGVPELKRLFSKEEILIQKIWRLLIDGTKVTKANIEKLKEGYSCTMDKFKEGDYAELFKYMTKETDEEGQVLTYENFVGLYYGLYRVKQIQGYGCLYQITDEIDLEEYEKMYKEFIEEIAKKESPAKVLETPQELLLDSQYVLISRKSYYKYLRTL